MCEESRVISSCSAAMETGISRRAATGPCVVGTASRTSVATAKLMAATRDRQHVQVRPVRAQLDPPLGGVLRPFDRMRRRRNEAEYPAGDRPVVTDADVVADRVKVEAIVQLAEKLLDQMSPY